jgi:hypothetical protein
MRLEKKADSVFTHRLVVRPSLRPVPFAIAIALAWSMHRSADIDDRAPNRSTALCEALASRSLTCDAADVTWLTGAHGVRGATFGGARALVRAESPGEPADLYLVDARLSPEGMLLAVDDDYDVTKTSGVAEGKPIVRGDLVAYTTSVDGIVTAIHTLDLSGKPTSFNADFTRLQNWQIGLTNLQQTGSRAGILHNAFSLDPPANQVDLSFSNSAVGTAVAATADGRAMLLDPKNGTAIEGGGWVRSVPDTQARPGNLVTWSVDRVRAMPWFGEEKMQVVKAVAFTALDFVLSARSKFFGDTTAADVAQDFAGLGGARESYTDPEIGWPPAPLTPLVKPALAGEGKWIVLDHDPFITDIPGTPSAFVTTFVRADKARLNTRVYVTLWDPRQIALHMEAGTVEPVSATGEAGPGVVPRTPEVLKSLVAGFNGGFQAVHGEYGMQANGVLYLPPKPYAATVLELRDGTTAFGAWPANTEVPDEVLSFRQNLTALVEDEKFNPWGRTWWGGTPKGWHDEIHTTRSGICITKENFVGYFWGNDISADVLAEGMILARCAFGIHLDMNPGLAGFEFYNVQNASNFQPLGRPIQPDWEYEGSFKDLPDFHVRARRMIKGMSHMNFPQYIHRDARDFFYLTRRPELPGADLVSAVSPSEPGEGQWRVKGLPQHGFPYALATTEIRLDVKHPDLRARIVRVDPRTVRPAASAGTSADTPTIISFTNATRFKPGEIAVVRGADSFFIGDSPPENSATLAVGYALADPRVAGAHAFAGVQDDDGMLVWVELADNAHVDDTTNALVDSLLKKMGCSSRVALASGTRALLGGELDLAAMPTPAPTTPVARLVRGDVAGGRLYFTDTPIVGPNVWQPLQMQRVRYFHHPDKKTDAGAADSDAGTP